MKRIPKSGMIPAIAAIAFGGLLTGCATTLEMGPGYYRYDSHLARAAPAYSTYSDSVVVYEPPAVRYVY